MYTLTEGRKSYTYLKKTTGLLWTVFTYLLKNVEHEIERDIRSSYAVWKHLTFLKITADFMNTLQFIQIMT